MSFAQFEHIHITIPLNKKQVVTSPPKSPCALMSDCSCVSPAFARHCFVQGVLPGAWLLWCHVMPVAFISRWEALVGHLLFCSASEL